MKLLEQDYSLLTEDEKRFYNRDLTRRGNYSLNNTAKTHYIVGKNIREVIAKNGDIMPEDLPTLKKSLKELEKKDRLKIR